MKLFWVIVPEKHVDRIDDWVGEKLVLYEDINEAVNLCSSGEILVRVEIVFIHDRGVLLMPFGRGRG